MASAVFFLGGQGFLQRAQTADLLTDFDQFAGELLVFPELSHFLLCLAHGGRGG
jgi:hypothetical protein